MKQLANKLFLQGCMMSQLHSGMNRLMLNLLVLHVMRISETSILKIYQNTIFLNQLKSM